VGIIEITLGLLLAVAAVAALGKWIPFPLPILLVAGGIALSYLPGFDDLRIEPDVFFLLFIPPLLFADGWVIPKRDLVGRSGRRDIWLDAVKAERKELMEMRKADVIDDEVMRVLQADIDLEETLIVGATRHEL
jgi:hypothetical protein